jgi:hypothetical protein
MKLEMKPFFHLQVEGDSGSILNALRKAGLTKQYEHFLSNQTALFDDDQYSDVVGDIPVTTMAELVSLLPVLAGKARAELCLFINGGNKEAGFDVLLGEKLPCEANAELHVDSSLFSKKTAEVAEAARNLLDELLIK